MTVCRRSIARAAVAGAAFAAAASAAAINLVRPETRADVAGTNYGVDGSGVVVVVLDRGIDWTHPDFRNDDGTTRILGMYDMSGQNYCAANNPAPVEYTRAQINSALTGGPTLAERDAVGHGTATAGTAAGNGRGMANALYEGIAPKVDLLIVKLTSEGAAAHDSQPAESAFVACYDQALDWVKGKLDALNEPAVLIINSGTQFGPIDGTSAVSQKLDATVGAFHRGRIVVLPAGDEGSLANHAGADFGSAADTTIGISRASTTFSVMTGWYDGAVPASITVSFGDGASVGPVAPGPPAQNGDGSIVVYNYVPGGAFYPWNTSADRSFWISVSGHATTGTFTIRAASGSGHVDLYGDVAGPNLTPITSITDHLVAGRLTDPASTRSAIVAGDYVLNTNWTDIDGNAQSITDEGLVDALWLKSSPGPTRDGRAYGVDVAAPGQNLFTSVSTTSYWATLRFNSPQGSPDNPIEYTRFGGTSGAAPIVVGAVALMLQANPRLDASTARRILRATARSDANTGTVPNTAWGYGKLDVYAAVGRAKDTVFLSAFDP